MLNAGQRRIIHFRVSKITYYGNVRSWRKLDELDENKTTEWKFKPALINSYLQLRETLTVSQRAPVFNSRY